MYKAKPHAASRCALRCDVAFRERKPVAAPVADGFGVRDDAGPKAKKTRTGQRALFAKPNS
jgi:hypothetical protein